MDSAVKKAKHIFFAVLSVWVAGLFVFLIYQSAYAEWSAPTCTPPNCNPEGASGGSAATLHDVLGYNNADGNSIAEFFGSLTDSIHNGMVVIGGALNADGTTKSGRVMFGLGTSTPGYSVDVVSQKIDASKDTAITRLGYSGDDKIWTGIRLDRNANKNQEKWFIGMNDSDDNFIIKTKDASGNDQPIMNVSQDQAAKGAACVGATFRQFSSNTWDGNVGGYEQANTKCSAGTHVCTTEEMYRTTLCNAGSISSAVNDDEAAWINGGVSVDCKGWTSKSIAISGTYWTFDGTIGRALTLNCDTPLKFACCR